MEVLSCYILHYFLMTLIFTEDIRLISFPFSNKQANKTTKTGLLVSFFSDLFLFVMILVVLVMCWFCWGISSP